MTKTMTKTITKIIATMTTIDLKNNQIYHIIMCIHLYMCYAMCLYVCVDAFINVFGLVCAFISVCLCLCVCISMWSYICACVVACNLYHLQYDRSSSTYCRISSIYLPWFYELCFNNYISSLFLCCSFPCSLPIYHIIQITPPSPPPITPAYPIISSLSNKFYSTFSYVSPPHIYSDQPILCSRILISHILVYIHTQLICLLLHSSLSSSATPSLFLCLPSYTPL